MKPETKYALLILGLSMLWKLVILLGGWVDSGIAKYPVIPVLAFMLIGMFRAVDARRKLDHPDGISFMAAFKAGISTSILFTLMYSLFIYLYITVFDAGFKARYVLNRVAELRENNTPEVDVQAWLRSTENFPFANIWVLFTFIGLGLLSLFYSLSIARMISRKFPQGL